MENSETSSESLSDQRSSAEPSRSLFLRDLDMNPEALQRLGVDLFTKIDITKKQSSPDSSQLIYFNSKLAASLGYEDLIAHPERRESLLKNGLDIDLEDGISMTSSRSHQDCWVDAQVDPTGIAMNGNTGSGRAVYFGKHFNRKGIGRTPHCRAPKDDLYGTGRMNLVSALWEILFSAVVSSDLSTTTVPILSAFVLKRRINVPGSPDQQWRTAVIDRIDRGELDRPTHLLSKLTKSRSINLKSIASLYGIQEGEKFIERILHGAWSNGNISLEGNTLDLETASAISSHHPQYTLQSRYITNYFGYEWKGQMRVLECLQSEAQINSENLSMSELGQIFSHARKQTIQKRWLDLIGIESTHREIIFEKYRDLSEPLVDIFLELSSKILPNLDALDGRKYHLASPHLFHFSSLFRRMIALREASPRRDQLISSGLQLLRPSRTPFDLVSNPEIPEDIKNHLMSFHVVHNSTEYEKLIHKAEFYIEKLNQLIDLIEAKHGHVFNYRKAYIVNEDRHYLSASFGRSFIQNIAESFDNDVIS